MTKNRILFTALLIVAFSFCANKQANAQVKIVADGRLQTILERHIEYNEMSHTLSGYRIKVNSFTGANAKAKAFALKDELMNTYPNTRAYVTFDEPNFVVKCGDFVTRLDAYNLFKDIKPQIGSAQIIKDWINNPVISEKDIIETSEYFEENLETDF
ncbi:MAG: hypothetical protein J6U84_08385 [Bacteroidales bacterium]|jgi:hypothetical protein|nr:hypothetical protein [Bacteroidales bacterium]